MKHSASIVSIAAAGIAVLMASATLAAQPGPQGYGPYGFYGGEEPWGGSYLGVDTQNVTADRIGPLHLKDETGVEVTMVDQDAPAGKAGLKEHDVILSINDQKVESVEQLRRLIHEIPAGRTITIGISRDGQPMTVKAQLAERDKMPGMNLNIHPEINIPAIHVAPFNMPEIDVPSIVVIHSPRSSGLMIENLTPQLGDFFGVKGGNGVLVRSVEKGSRGEQAGFHAGDVIVKINGSSVNDCSDFSRLLRARTANKAAVTIVRDRHEQTLTLALPEPRRTGAVYKGKGCQYLSPETCEEIYNDASEIAALGPQLAEQMKKIQPDVQEAQKQLEQAKKQMQHEIASHQGELKREMQQLQKQLEKQREQLEKQVRHWEKQTQI